MTLLKFVPGAELQQSWHKIANDIDHIIIAIIRSLKSSDWSNWSMLGLVLFLNTRFFINALTMECFGLILEVLLVLLLAVVENVLHVDD